MSSRSVPPPARSEGLGLGPQKTKTQLCTQLCSAVTHINRITVTLPTLAHVYRLNSKTRKSGERAADRILRSNPVAGVGDDEPNSSGKAPRDPCLVVSSGDRRSTTDGDCFARPEATNGRDPPGAAAAHSSSLRPRGASASCPRAVRGGGKTVDERISTLLRELGRIISVK